MGSIGFELAHLFSPTTYSDFGFGAWLLVQDEDRPGLREHATRRGKIERFAWQERTAAMEGKNLPKMGRRVSWKWRSQIRVSSRVEAIIDRTLVCTGLVDPNQSNFEQEKTVMFAV